MKEVLGWTGMLLLVVAQLLLSNGRLTHQKWHYWAIDFVGGILLVVYASQDIKSLWPAAVLNSIWAINSLFGLVKVRR